MLGEWKKLKHTVSLGVNISSDGGMGDEVNHRITEAKKAWGALKDLWKRGIYLERQK